MKKNKLENKKDCLENTDIYKELIPRGIKQRKHTGIIDDYSEGNKEQ